MKGNLHILSTLKFSALLLILAIVVVSCGKEEVIDSKPQLVLKDNFDFFNTFAPQFEDLFPEDAWELMNQNPEVAYTYYTGKRLHPAFAGNIEWVPYVAVSDHRYSLREISGGIEVASSGDGTIFIDGYGNNDASEETVQKSLFNGDVTGDHLVRADRFEFLYEIIGGLDGDKVPSGLLDAVLENQKNTGDFEDSRGFALRKSASDLPGTLEEFPADPEGETQIVTIGYLMVID